MIGNIASTATWNWSGDGSLDDSLTPLRRRRAANGRVRSPAGVSTGYVYDVLKRRYPPGRRCWRRWASNKVTYYEADFAAGVDAPTGRDGDIRWLCRRVDAI